MAARLDREGARLAMNEGALRLRGIAAALRRLAEDLSEADDDARMILDLLARDVDLEAEAMGEVEVFLHTPQAGNGAAKGGA